MSRREKTETVIECDGCNRTMRERDARCAYAQGIDLCEYCVNKLVALPPPLANLVLTAQVHKAMEPIRLAIAQGLAKRLT